MDLLMFNLMIALITLLFFIAFMTIYIVNRHMKAAGWISATFLMGMIAQAADRNREILEPYFLDRVAEPAFWGSCVFVVMAYASRTNTRPNFKLMATIAFVGLAVIMTTAIVPLRAIIMEWTAAAILLCGYPILKQHRNQVTTNMLFWFNNISIVFFVFRPFIIIGGYHPSLWTDSFHFYQAALYLSSSILSVIGANIIFVALGSDLIERHQKEAMIDPLTGLLNRRGMSNIFRDMERSPAKSKHTGRAILLFDIDHFKKVNDEFGHDVGDTVLTNIGGAVRQLIQFHGEASRSGGEEFVILFNAESSQAAFLITEHLRVAISLLKHEGMPDDRRVTASFGLAFIRPDEPVKRLIRRADVALYAAKDAGRNRLRVAEGDILPEANESMKLPRPSVAKAI